MSTVRIVTGRPFISSTARLYGLELLSSSGRLVLAVHEQEFAAEQADAHRARLQRGLRVVRQLDVGHRSIFVPSSVCAGVLQALQLALLAAPSRSAGTILFEHDRRGIDDHDAGVAVDDDQSSWRISALACGTPTAAGMSRLRATIAVCEFGRRRR